MPALAAKPFQLALQLKAGLGIMWPFLGPVGTETGVEATSSYNTSPYTNPANFSTHVGSWLTNVALAAGADHIRLFFNPGPILECIKTGAGMDSRKVTLLNEIAAAVDVILAAGLKCYLDVHLTGYVTGYGAAEHLDGTAGTKFLRYITLLQNLATKFAAYNPASFAIEPFNEPPDPYPTDLLGYTGNYAAMAAAMHAAIRAIMPRHTIIMTCDRYSHPWQMVNFDPDAYDKNTLWTYHWYPLSSLQGYQQSDYTKWFDGYPWEKRPEDRPRALAQVTARVNADAGIPSGDKAAKITAVMVDYDLMVTRGRDYIDSEIAAVVAWAATNAVSIFCGEYGIHGDNGAVYGMLEESRIRNIRDINLTLAKYGQSRTLMAVDAIDYHVPGNAAGVQTLDAFTTPWLEALMFTAGFAKAS